MCILDMRNKGIKYLFNMYILLLLNLLSLHRPKVDKQYSRDVYIFLFFLLVFVAFVFTISKTKDQLLVRDQTEEWKGWMQVSNIAENSVPGKKEHFDAPFTCKIMSNQY